MSNTKSELKEKVAKMLFELCGTTQMPSENKNSVLTMIGHYQKALAKESFLESVDRFFKDNSHVVSIELDGQDEYDDEGGTIYYTSPGDIDLSSDYENNHSSAEIEKECERLREEVYNEAIAYQLLEEDLLRDLAPFKLHKDISLLRNTIMTEPEKEIFNAVELYEKNLLAAQVATSEKTTTKNYKMKV